MSTLTIPVYKAARGSHITDADAKIIIPILEQKFGDRPITAPRLVEAARSKRSPLHRYLTWDDREAAEQYRLVQARGILRAIFVVQEVGGEQIESRAYHQIVVTTNGDSERAYVSERVVWQRPDYREQVIEKAKRELVGWRERYRVYNELASIIGALDEVL